jgi:hypothetical protein
LGFQSRVINASNAGGLAVSWLAALAGPFAGAFGVLALLGSALAAAALLLEGLLAAALDFVGLLVAATAGLLEDVSRSRFMIERES